jgi:branched-chain amino acid aminotransferase
VAVGTNIKTYYDGAWHDGNVPIMRAADHGAWQGTTVFDGARYVDGVAPDLMRHCERVVASARALMLHPPRPRRRSTTSSGRGCAAIPGRRRLRPADVLGHRRRRLRHHPGRDARRILRLPRRGAIAPPEAAVRLTTTQFHRPVMTDNVCNAKAGCLYPNNARMLAEAMRKGYDNALVADALGNVAETARPMSSWFATARPSRPIPNGTFLNGITRSAT